MKILCYIFPILLLLMVGCTSTKTEVTSPDGQIKLTFRLNDITK